MEKKFVKSSWGMQSQSHLTIYMFPRANHQWPGMLK